MEKCEHNQASWMPGDDGYWVYLCIPCGHAGSGLSLDAAKKDFTKLDLENKLEVLRQRRRSGEKLSYQEHRLLQYSEPMCCSRR